MIVHLVSDRRRLAPSSGSFDLERACLLEQARRAVEAGIDVFQVRERDLDDQRLADIVGELVRLSRGSRTRIVVNDRMDVALACGADGVHLRADSVPPAVARTLAPPGFLVGRSVHSVDMARSATEADYLIAGTVWPTASKPADAPRIGIDGFTSIAGAASSPVLAIGGVTLERVGEVRAAGGAGIAAIGLFCGSDSTAACGAVPLTAIAAAIRARFDSSR